MWDALEPLTRSWPEPVREAIRDLASTSNAANRRRSIIALADLLGEQQTAFILRFLTSESAQARRIALELLARHGQPTKELVRAAQSAISDPAIPLNARVNATRVILNSTGEQGAEAVAVLRALVRGLPRRRILDRVEPIARRLGHPPAFDAIRVELYDGQKLRCPRCGVMERRHAMVQHLWNRHFLLLDGHRARSPFQVLDDRLQDPDLPATLTELNRALLARGFNDDESLEYLQEQANERHESLCPKCFSFVSSSEPPLPTPANLTTHRLSAEGCTVAVDERGCWPRLRIETANHVIHSGPQPGGGWSSSVWRWAGVVCALLGLWATALLPIPWHVVTGCALLAEGLLLFWWANRLERRPANTVDRIVNLAWQRLVPELPPGLALSRIAQASVGRGDVADRTEVLNLALAATEAAVRGRAVPTVSLVPLWWLHAEDQHRKGRDMLPTLAGRIGSCFSGDLPMSAGGGLCDLFESKRRTSAETSRCRALLSEQAFAHGLEVWDVLELARAFPSLGRAMMTHDLDSLARLRLVWACRKDRPWSSCGPAVTVFELARYPVIAALALASAPDVLLYQPLPPPGPGDDPLPLLLSGRGLVVGRVVVREKPTNISVRQRESWRGGGFELRLGGHRLRFAHDPSELADRLRRWAAYWFDQFLPEVDNVLKYRATDRLADLMQPLLTNCGLCGLHHVPVPGDVGFIPTLTARVS